MSGPHGGDGADDVARALDLLARRADDRPGADRVPAVRRRARRRAQVRTAGFGAALVVAVAGAGLVALSGLDGSDRGAPAVRPGGPGMELSVEQETDPVVLRAVTHVPTGSFVVLRIRITGLVPNGSVGLRVEQPGIGYTGDSGPDCSVAQPLRRVNRDELETVVWDVGPARSEVVLVTATACAPVGARTLRVSVPVPASTGQP